MLQSSSLSQDDNGAAAAVASFGAAGPSSPSLSAATPHCFRIAGITIKNGEGNGPIITINPAKRVVALWRVLDLCVEAEERLHAHHLHLLASCDSIENSSSENMIPAALTFIEVQLLCFGQPIGLPIIGRMTTTYPKLVRSLQVFNITGNNYDENADVAAFAALATQLRELHVCACGLTSVQGLAGRCEFLTKVNLRGSHLSTIDGLEHHVFLNDVYISGTPIRSLEPLLTCPSLAKVSFSSCRQLSSLEGLQYHRHLKEVDGSNTAISSVEPLRTCPALTRVVLRWCEQLPSEVDLPASVCFIRI